MNVYTTEKEQLDELRQLWKKYGMSTIAGIVIALLLSFGWRYWNQIQERTLVHASVRYEQLLTAIANNDVSGIEHQSTYLINRYPHTTYAEFAGLFLAQQAVNKGDFQTAEDKLNWVMKKAKTDAVSAIAAIRLARVQLANKQPEKALNTLKSVKDKSYLALAEEVKGDVYVVLGQMSNAHEAYATALKSLRSLLSARPILEMKLHATQV